MFGSSDGRPYNGRAAQRGERLRLQDARREKRRRGGRRNDRRARRRARLFRLRSDPRHDRPQRCRQPPDRVRARRESAGHRSKARPGCESLADPTAPAAFPEQRRQLTSPAHVGEYLLRVAVRRPGRCARNQPRSRPCSRRKLRSPAQPYINSGGISPRSFASAFLMMRGSHGMPSSRSSLAGRLSVETSLVDQLPLLDAQEIIPPDRVDEENRLPIRIAVVANVVIHEVEKLVGRSDQSKRGKLVPVR